MDSSSLKDVQFFNILHVVVKPHDVVSQSQ